MRNTNSLGNIFGLLGIILILVGMVENGFDQPWWPVFLVPGLVCAVISVLEFELSDKRKGVPIRRNY